MFVVPPERSQEPSTCSSFPAETFMSEVYLWFIANFVTKLSGTGQSHLGKWVEKRKERSNEWVDKVLSGNENTAAEVTLRLQECV